MQLARYFYPAPQPSGKRGRPRKDGESFKGSDPTTHGPADMVWSGQDGAGKLVSVQVWHRLHLRKAREVTLSAIQNSRQSAAGSKRDPRMAWFWWIGETCPVAEQLAEVYARRYGQEHRYRYDKQDLLWDTPRVRTPKQMERWTDVVAVVRNQLVLARGEAEAVLRPWERAQRPCTPRQVRHAMGKISVQLGTPARPPQPRGKAPGRKQGNTSKRAPRCEVIRKSPRRAKVVRKRRC